MLVLFLLSLLLHSPPPASCSKVVAWHARASSGDTRSALLQPHQVLLSHDDAVLQLIQPLDLLRVRFASSHSVLILESVIARRLQVPVLHCVGDAFSCICGRCKSLENWKTRVLRSSLSEWTLMFTQALCLGDCR
uniref:RxLR effector candidate protein n=1 Tax=Hyaloperonospora arabidopsidis (strain Emoy2) TaxID=559515 RepID=M4BQM2_HYAAE